MGPAEGGGWGQMGSGGGLFPAPPAGWAGVCLLPCAGRGVWCGPLSLAACALPPLTAGRVLFVAPHRAGCWPVWPCDGPAGWRGFVCCPAPGGGGGPFGLALAPPDGGAFLLTCAGRGWCCQMGPSIAHIAPLRGERGFVCCPAPGESVRCGKFGLAACALPPLTAGRALFVALHRAGACGVASLALGGPAVGGREIVVLRTTGNALR